MPYTLTMDASLKIKGAGGHPRGWMHHIARDVEVRNGTRRVHANPRIDPERTLHNGTMVRGSDGELRECTDVNEIADAVDARLSVVKKRVRKDAVVMRPLILQLDPKWFDKHNPDWRENGLNDDAADLHAEMLAWAENEFGRDNIVCASLHMDEVSPQLQVGFVPVTNDGRLSQKDYFRGPKDLSRQHDEFRAHMASVGYDVDFGRSARSKERLSSDEFARRAEQMRDGLDRVAEREAAVTRDEAAVAALRRALDDREQTLAGGEAAWKDQEPKLRKRARQAAHDAGRSDVTKARQAAKDREQAAEKREQAAQAARAALEQAREEAIKVVDDAQRAQAKAQEIIDGSLELPTTDDIYARAEKEMPDIWRIFLVNQPEVKKAFITFVSKRYAQYATSMKAAGFAPLPEPGWVNRTVADVEEAARAEYTRLVAQSEQRERDDDGLSL